MTDKQSETVPFRRESNGSVSLPELSFASSLTNYLTSRYIFRWGSRLQTHQIRSYVSVAGTPPPRWAGRPVDLGRETNLRCCRSRGGSRRVLEVGRESQNDVDSLSLEVEWLFFFQSNTGEPRCATSERSTDSVHSSSLPLSTAPALSRVRCL